MATPTPDNPTKVNYKLGAGVNVADIDHINLGIRPAAGTVGVYPVSINDVTFTADGDGISHEDLAAFGMIAPGKYICAGQTVMKAGGVSDWSGESPVFTINAVKPNPPTAVTVS